MNLDEEAGILESLGEAIQMFGCKSRLAEKIGYTSQLVGMWTSGKTRISAEAAIRIQIATQNAVMAYELRPDLPWREIIKPKRLL